MGHPTGKTPPRGSWVGLPPRPFLYTADQIGELLNLSTSEVKRKYLWYDKRSVGARPPDKLLAINIAPRDNSPEWRITENELIRWMKGLGLRYYERGWFE
jgi:hypothetical protein